MGAQHAVSQSAFEAKYRHSSDPWRFADSPYEQRRYATVLRSLPEMRYASAFEPGCSIGVLTARLASRCDALLASDIAPTAVRLARERCALLRNVRIEQADLAKTLPDGPFDLIVLSELGYYFTAAELGRITRELAARLTSGGDFVAVHWLGESTDHVLHGDEVHAVLAETLQRGGAWISGALHPEFRLEVWRCA